MDEALAELRPDGAQADLESSDDDDIGLSEAQGLLSRPIRLDYDRSIEANCASMLCMLSKSKRSTRSALPEKIVKSQRGGPASA